MKNKKTLTLTILGLLSLIVITVGVTYAFFSYTKEGTTENSITTGTITFLYTEVSGVGRGISIDDAYPISDSVGKAQTGEGKVFDFKVTSTTQMNASVPYEVTARKKSDSTLDESAVKLYLTKVDGTEEEVLLDNYSNLTQTDKIESSRYVEKTIYNGKVPANSINYEQNFRLRMWIDEEVDFSQNEDGSYPYNDKTFTVTVNVYANAKVVTEEDIELQSNNEISSIQVGSISAVPTYSEDYNYEIGLASGTTTASLKIKTVSEDTNVKVESMDSLTYSSNIKRLSSIKSVSLSEGDNYFKITTTALSGEERESIINVHVGEYKEKLLNETDPILSDNLIPVIIAANGDVYKVDNNYSWYNYENKQWANAVVLKTNTTYQAGAIIPESNIDGYFVWIPRYKYEIFNEGNYNSTTTVDSKPTTSAAQEINIVFENKNTAPSTGSTVGTYLTHPAFTTLDVNGIWVAKFESSGSTSDINILPNVTSLREVNVKTMFELAYNYDRNSDSHMMKNTEWGAVAYLSHSKYGINQEIRINNSSTFTTGCAATTPALNYVAKEQTDHSEGYYAGCENAYNTSIGVLASTTGNITGIYDMSGGTWEYMASYLDGVYENSGFDATNIALYDSKYFDVYPSDSTIASYNYRILGDATGELGPFYSYVDNDSSNRNHNTWYSDYSHFIKSSHPWLRRGGYYSDGVVASSFAFGNREGGAVYNISFRIVLAP